MRKFNLMWWQPSIPFPLDLDWVFVFTATFAVSIKTAICFSYFKVGTKSLDLERENIQPFNK